MKLSTIALTALSIGITAASLTLPRSRPRQHGNPLPLQDSLQSFSPEGTSVVYNTLWAGAVLSPGGNGNFRSVTANVVVNPATLPPGSQSNREYASTTWVGIDGTGCSTTALLQTGVDSYVTNGNTRYEGWWEWYPGPSTPFQNFAIKLGDEIRMSVNATSSTSGTAKLENLTTGKSVTKSLSNQAKLCYQSADWVVEDFYSNGQAQVVFANFTTVQFTKASATKADGTTVGVNGAEIFGVQHGNTIYTDCNTSGSSTVTCKYRN